mgnify:FL=1
MNDVMNNMNNASPQALNGKPFANAYEDENVNARISSTTAERLTPKPLFADNNFNNCGNLTIVEPNMIP